MCEEADICWDIYSLLWVTTWNQCWTTQSLLFWGCLIHLLLTYELLPSTIKEYVLFTEGTSIGLVQNLLLFLLSMLFIVVCVTGEEPEICQISQSDPVCPTIVSIGSHDSPGLTSHDLPSLYLMYPPHFWEWTLPSWASQCWLLFTYWGHGWWSPVPT